MNLEQKSAGFSVDVSPATDPRVRVLELEAQLTITREHLGAALADAQSLFGKLAATQKMNVTLVESATACQAQVEMLKTELAEVAKKLQSHVAMQGVRQINAKRERLRKRKARK